MNEQEILRRMAKLGIDDFETVADVERSQQKFLRNLDKSSIHPSCYAGFEDCNEIFCGRDKCSEVCRFGVYGRRLKHIATAHDLITQCGEPIFEIRLARGCWVRPADELDKIKIAAAKKLNRRALDSLYHPDLVAIGALKVQPATRIDSVFWIAEIHELIAGAELENIKAAFTPEGRSPNGPPEYENIFWAEKVENVAQALSNIFNYGLKSWQDPRDTAGARGESGTKSKWRVTSYLFGPADVTRALWEEYYQWRFALPANICLIRYGCDRHFNKLAKEPRLIKAPKKRPISTLA